MKRYVSPGRSCRSDSRARVCSWTSTSRADTALVAAHRPRVERRGPGDRHPLPLATGELVRPSLGPRARQRHPLQQLVGPAASRGAVPDPGDPERLVDDVLDRVRGSRDPYGSWNTGCVVRRIARRRARPVPSRPPRRRSGPRRPWVARDPGPSGARADDTEGAASTRRGCHSCWGSRRICAVGPDSTISPFDSTTTVSARSAVRPRSWVISIIDVPCAEQGLQVVEDLALAGDVERAGRLVGDEELGVAGERDGDQHPPAHAPGELVRVLTGAARRVGDAGLAHQLDRPVPGLGSGGEAVGRERLADPPPDPQHGIDVGHRVLRHQPDLAPAQPQRSCPSVR